MTMMVSAYRAKQLRSDIRWHEEYLRSKRPELLASMKSAYDREGRESAAWAYCTFRRDLSKARAALAAVIIAKAPNWSPAARKRRGWE